MIFWKCAKNVRKASFPNITSHNSITMMFSGPTWGCFLLPIYRGTNVVEQLFLRNFSEKSYSPVFGWKNDFFENSCKIVKVVAFFCKHRYGGNHNRFGHPRGITIPGLDSFFKVSFMTLIFGAFKIVSREKKQKTQIRLKHTITFFSDCLGAKFSLRKTFGTKLESCMQVSTFLWLTKRKIIFFKCCFFCYWRNLWVEVNYKSN